MQGEAEVIYKSLHTDCSQVCLPDFRLLYFFILISLLPLTIVLFIAVLEKQKVFVPPLLLQKKNKCNNKLP